MGALILLLMAMSQKIRQQAVAEQRAKQDETKQLAAQPTEPELPPLVIPRRKPTAADDDEERARREAAEAARAEKIAQRDELRKQAELADEERERLRLEFEQKLTSTRAKLDRERERLRALNDSGSGTDAERARLSAQLKKLSDDEAALLEDEERVKEDEKQLERQAFRLKEELAATRLRIDLSRQKQATQSNEVLLVPYDGASGTLRRPIYIECTGSTLRFLPEKETLTADDLLGFGESFNPLLAASNALLKHWTDQRRSPDDPQPYVLLIVRPSGTVSYYLARRLLARMRVPFGYELVEEDWVLKIPDADARAKMLVRNAINDALTTREVALKSANANGELSGDSQLLTLLKMLKENEKVAERDRTSTAKEFARGHDPLDGGAGSLAGTKGGRARSDGMPRLDPGGSDLIEDVRPGRFRSGADGSGDEVASTGTPRNAGTGSAGSAGADARGQAGGRSRDLPTLDDPPAGASAADAPTRSGATGTRAATDGITGREVDISPSNTATKRPRLPRIGEGETPSEATSDTRPAARPAGIGLAPPGSSTDSGDPRPETPTDGSAPPPRGPAPREVAGGGTPGSGAKAPDVELKGPQPGYATATDRDPKPSTREPAPNVAANSDSPVVATTPSTGSRVPTKRADWPSSTAPGSTPDPGGKLSPVDPNGGVAARSASATFNKGGKLTRRWGKVNGNASLGLEKKVEVHCLADRLLIGPDDAVVHIRSGDKKQDLVDRLTLALDATAQSWGKPPNNFYFVPMLQFIVYPGGQAHYERLSSTVKEWGLPSSMEPARDGAQPRTRFGGNSR